MPPATRPPVLSRSSTGSTLNIYLPHAPVKVPEETPAAPRPAARGTGTIALVEDEEQLRVLLRRILKRAGYDVIDAANGIEGLRLFKDHPGPIDLLLTDVMMPRMTGPQMVAELRPLRPGLRVLYMSGYTDGAITPQGELQANVKFLQKPVIPDTLLQKVREVIEQA